MLNNNCNNNNGNKNKTNDINNADGAAIRRLVTDPLDDAMRELLDICQQYNDKFAMKKPDNIKNFTSSSSPTSMTTRPQYDNYARASNRSGIDDNLAQTNPNQLLETLNCDTKTFGQNENISCQERCKNNQQTSQCKTSNDYTPLSQANQATSLNSALFGSIERLQIKQSELQKQLDEVTRVARELESKQKRKLSSILEDSDSLRSNHDELDDEDDELIEFQQIENELRISELNRQLGNIQEELRLRLYKRLLSNTTNGARTSHLQQQHQTHLTQNPVRRNSADDSSPPSSSCSDEQTATSTSTYTATDSSSSQVFTGPSSVDAEVTTKQKQLLSDRIETVKSPDSGASDFSFGEIKNSNVPEECHQLGSCTTQIETYQDQQKIQDRNTMLDIEMTRSTGIEQVDGCQSQDAATTSLPQENLNYELGNNNNNNKINNNNTMQLERIEEDEEDDEDFYSNSDRLRTIYEEKLSPIIRASTLEDNKTYNHTACQENGQYVSIQPESSSTSQDYEDNDKNRLDGSTGFSNPGFDSSNVNSASRSNRPLTLYLPKPDEEIDLMEHVQALGHDLNIICKDITLTPASAHGYLYKSCSSNSKKWLKRYFYFDRTSKILAYYENSGQLVKKRNSTPRNVIPFDEIGDVYVEHRLSSLDEKERSSKKNSFVFVLSTIKRKYMLASSNAETMRAWIDILFTAAKANDYFQQLDNPTADNESYEFQNY